MMLVMERPFFCLARSVSTMLAFGPWKTQTLLLSWSETPQRWMCSVQSWSGWLMDHSSLLRSPLPGLSPWTCWRTGCCLAFCRVWYVMKVEDPPIITWHCDSSLMTSNQNEGLGKQPPSPNHIPLNFFVWGYVKKCLHIPSLPDTFTKLKEHIHKAVPQMWVCFVEHGKNLNRRWIFAVLLKLHVWSACNKSLVLVPPEWYWLLLLN